jgi:hypothetical protein
LLHEAKAEDHTHKHAAKGLRELGRIGGKTRAKNLTPEQRKAISEAGIAAKRQKAEARAKTKKKGN